MLVVAISRTVRATALVAVLAAAWAGCDSGARPLRRDLSGQAVDDAGAGDDGGGSSDDLATGGDLAGADLARRADLAAPPDLSRAPDLTVLPDLTALPDLVSLPDLARAGVITGGPCLSGAGGATAFRVKWVNGGGRATVSYEVNGLPDKARWKVAAYGYQIGYVPQFADPFLGEGGLQLDGSSFIDVELSTAGVGNIRRATLAIYGRSYSVGSSGSFSWQTLAGVSQTPRDHVSNVAPYRWYGGDATAELRPNDGGILLRIKAGPSSGSLVVNRLELCVDAG